MPAWLNKEQFIRLLVSVLLLIPRKVEILNECSNVPTSKKHGTLVEHRKVSIINGLRGNVPSFHGIR
jgi:hypothetical protein